MNSFFLFISFSLTGDCSDQVGGLTPEPRQAAFLNGMTEVFGGSRAGDQDQALGTFLGSQILLRKDPRPSFPNHYYLFIEGAPEREGVLSYVERDSDIFIEAYSGILDRKMAGAGSALLETLFRQFPNRPMLATLSDLNLKRAQQLATELRHNKNRGRTLDQVYQVPFFHSSLKAHRRIYFRIDEEMGALVEIGIQNSAYCDEPFDFDGLLSFY